MLKLKFPKIKTDTKQNIIIGTLAVLLLLSNFSIVAQFLGRLNPLAGYQGKIDQLERRAVILEFDRVRLEDASNLLLALQDYQFEKRVFPLTLEELKTDGYLDPQSRLTDPLTDLPYLYERRGQGFLLCIWLSDMVKGVNTGQCPSSAEEAESLNKSPQTDEGTASQAEEQKLRIVADAVVNVREEPSINSSVVARVTPGEEYVFTETQGDWYRIIVNSEKSGWILNDYTSPISAE